MSLLDLKHRKSRAIALRALILKGIEGGEDGAKAAKCLHELKPTPKELMKAVAYLKKHQLVAEAES